MAVAIHSSIHSLVVFIVMGAMDQYLGEPAEVAREKERERSAGLAALKGCGFAAEDQRTALRRLCR